jgi:hypothetical protein
MDLFFDFFKSIAALFDFGGENLIFMLLEFFFDFIHIRFKVNNFI